MCVVVLTVLFSLFQSCQADLVKDNGHKYFLSVLADPYMPVRTGHICSHPAAFPCLVSAAVLQFWCHVGLPPLQAPRAELGTAGLWAQAPPSQGACALSPGVLKAGSLGCSWGSRVAAGARNCPTALAIASVAAGLP